MIKYLKYFSFLNLIFIAFLIFACKNMVKSEYPQADWSDVDYSGNNHISQKMDIYLPKNNIYSQLILKPDGDHCGNTLMFHHSKKMAEFFYDQYNNQL